MENEEDDDKGISTDADTTFDNFKRLVMLNDVILRKIFKFVDFRTLKDCRLVSTKWKCVSEPSFRKRAKVVMWNKRDKEICEINSLKRLFSQDECSVTISSLLLAEAYPWKSAELEEFFGNEGRLITELRFENLILVDDVGGRYKNIDLTPFLMPTLKRLSITNAMNYRYMDNDDSMRCSVSLDGLQSLDYLCLTDCIINFNVGCRISPKDFIMEGHSKFISGGAGILTKLLLNNFLCLRRLENLIIRDRGVNLSLDLDGSFVLKHVELPHQMSLINWDRCKWRINTLKLDGIDILQRTQMEFNTLEISGSKIDLSVVPSTIESLRLEQCTEIYLRSRMHMPQLKRLRSVNNKSFDFLAHFRDCNSLKELRMGLTNNWLTLNVENIPRNVQILVLNKDMTRFTGSRTIVLDTLALVGCHFDNWEFSKLPVRHLYCVKRYGFIFTDDVIQRIIKISQENCETISFGPVTWRTDKEFTDSFLSNYVDKKAEYYTFKSGRGVAVSENLVHGTCWS